MGDFSYAKIFLLLFGLLILIVGAQDGSTTLPSIETMPTKVDVTSKSAKK